jgi:2-dehydropantoate 2-reductase
MTVTAAPPGTGPRVLIVGAGATGVFYGWYLLRGGARVTYLVRPRYVEEVAAGFAVYDYGRPRYSRHIPERFEGYDVLGDADAALAAGPWDQVWLCVSSPAIHTGDWLERLVEGTGDAAIVSLPPGLHDAALLNRLAGEARVVNALFSGLSWPAPLPGEALPEPGIAWWSPAFVPHGFGGARAEQAVAALRAGKGEARVVRDAAAQRAIGTAMLLPVTSALESVGWSLDALLGGDALRDGCAASREGMAIAEAEVGARPGPLPAVVRPWLIGTLIRLARRFAPLDLETYLRVHFTKVGEQTRATLRTYVEAGARHGIPTPASARLLETVQPTGV